VLIVELRLQDIVLIYIFMYSTLWLKPEVPKFLEFLF